jgi:peroxiredoxin (alkyl hydroperoxide reductase subunit C)
METEEKLKDVRGMPRLNEPAPDFEVTTSHGVRKLSEYRGKWLVFFSHPADFTPVCTTEFMAFARHYEDFKALNCELLGLSVDSVQSHLAWMQNVKEKFGVEIPFPVAADVSMRVASTYGMIQPSANDTSTVRATFVIDDKGIVRAMIYYPKTNGRSITEVLRILETLQLSDQRGVATPEGWKRGDQVIVPPPGSIDELAVRRTEGHDCADWYFCKKAV